MHDWLKDFPAFPLVATVAITVAAVLGTWQPPQARTAQGPPENQFLVQSPMGSWVSIGRPTAHLNGTVEFFDSFSGDRVQIDNGGVVIVPYRPDR
jgi:hypothetical protein